MIQILVLTAEVEQLKEKQISLQYKNPPNPQINLIN